MRHVRRPSAAGAAPAAAAVVVLLLLAGHLLAPATLLVARDVVTFHLPLRAAAVDLALAHGLPEWNPTISGGQPVLSNPNYAWFYPPTWLALAVPPAYSLSLLAVAHGLIALAGSWRLLRRLGAAPDAAGLGAMGFAASAWFLSLAHTFNFLCSMAWLPWVLAAAERLWAAAPGQRLRAAATVGALVALQLLAGEPVAVLLSALALLCLALPQWRRWRSSLPLLLGAAAFALLLGAVQLLPTAVRLQGSARDAGLSDADAGKWSARPERLVDLALPRFWGDAQRDEEGLWFGWEVHDASFPYVIALTSGGLLLVLAAASAGLRIPHRGGWWLAAGAGVFLALGRHNPLWDPLRDLVPLLGLVRYPEKFLVLTAAVVPLAGALAWDHLRRAAAAGNRRPAGLATVLAAIALLASLAVWASHGTPAAAERFVRAHSGLPPSPATLAHATGFVQREAAATVAIAAATTAVLALLAFGGRTRRWAPALATVVLAADLLWYGRGALPTLPAALVLAPPPLASAVAAAGGRLHVGEAAHGEPEVHLRRGPPGFQQLWGRRERLDPYVAALWGARYALNRDYDLMLTPWGRHALERLAATPGGPARDRLLGLWDVRSIVVPRAPSAVMAELRATRRLPSEVDVRRNAWALPAYRFVTALARVPDAPAAARALAAASNDLRGRDACVGDAGPAAGGYAPGELLAVADAGQRVRVRYRAGGAAVLVVATTFDPGWSAALGSGAPLPTCPTLAGQLAVGVPAGEHEIVLRHRDPWVRVGAAVSLATLLGLVVAAARQRRRATAVQSAP